MGCFARGTNAGQALLALRKRLGLYTKTLRPALLFPELADACPLRPEIVAGGLDLMVVRELTGGIYFGEKGYKNTEMGQAAYDVEIYAEEEVKRIAIAAFEMARKRSKSLSTSIKPMCWKAQNCGRRGS